MTNEELDHLEKLEAKIGKLEIELRQERDRHHEELRAAVGDACAWQYWRDKTRELEEKARARVVVAL